jgi:hypothetical protein
MMADTSALLPRDRRQLDPASHTRSSQTGARAAFASLDKMLEPDVLATILGRPVRTVQRTPHTVDDSTTDASFEAIRLDGAPGPSLISKTVERDKDWLAIATHDQVDREVRTWESGILARVPFPAAHAVVAAARTDTGYTVLMHDLSDHLLPNGYGASLPNRHQARVIEALASVHATFWMDPSLGDPALGLASLRSFMGSCSPRTVERIRLRMGRTDFTDWLEEGWDKLPSTVDPKLADDLRAIADDPTLADEKMRGLPSTLVHADPRPANLAIDARTGRVYFLDWARPAVAPPAIDLAYWSFTANNDAPIPREDLLRGYAAALERRLGSRFSSDWWEPQLDLCFVAFVASFAPIIANINPEAAIGWTERCRPGLRALG